MGSSTVPVLERPQLRRWPLSTARSYRLSRSCSHSRRTTAIDAAEADPSRDPHVFGWGSIRRLARERAAIRREKGARQQRAQKLLAYASLPSALHHELANGA